MSMAFTTRAGSLARSFLKRCIANRDGIAAVEFGLIAPVMLIMLVGSVEASRAISIDRRFTSVTSMVGDLVSREQSMGDNQSEHIAKITAMMASIEHVMKPHPYDTLEIEILPVMGFGDGTDTRLYASSYKYSAGTVSVGQARCTAYTLPEGLIAAGGSVIVVEAKYTYKPLSFSTWLFGTSYDWEDKAINSPRQGFVDYGGGIGGTC